MHLLEQYALSCGVKIDKPFIETSFFPLPFEKYIILHASSGMGSKNYDYWQDVVNEFLSLHSEFKIVQIGGNEDIKINGVYRLCGKTNLKQTAYLIKNCQAIIGNDSFSMHVAGGFNKPIVSLYGILFKNCCKPYFGDEDNKFLLEADFSKIKPTFSANENQKRVNEIKPEKIVSSLISALKLKTNVSYKTIYIGDKYQFQFIEIVPDFILSPDSFHGQKMIVRMDWHHDENALANLACAERELMIASKKEIPLELLNQIKDYISGIHFEVCSDDDFVAKNKYFKQIQQLGLNLNIGTKDKNNLSKIRFELFDFEVEEILISEKKELDIDDKNIDNLRYTSNRKILAKDGVFNCKSDWENRLEKNNKVTDSPSFWEDVQFMRVIENGS